MVGSCKLMAQRGLPAQSSVLPLCLLAQQLVWSFLLRTDGLSVSTDEATEEQAAAVRSTADEQTGRPGMFRPSS